MVPVQKLASMLRGAHTVDDMGEDEIRGSGSNVNNETIPEEDGEEEKKDDGFVPPPMIRATSDGKVVRPKTTFGGSGGRNNLLLDYVVCYMDQVRSYQPSFASSSFFTLSSSAYPLSSI